MQEFVMLSESYKKRRLTDYNIQYNNLLASIIDMFEFTGIPDSVRPDMLIRYLFSNGVCAIPLNTDDPPVCICSLCGKVDAYGYGSEVIATTQNGKSYEGKIGEDIAIFKNNTYMYPEYYILQTAEILTELYTSLRCNIINARLAPIGKAKTDSQKNALKTAFNDIYKGIPNVIKDGNIFEGDNSLIENFTDVKNSQYIPYLSQLEDDILQKFYYHYGLNLNNVNKRAQVSAEEVTGADPLVWTVPLQKLGELKKGCEMLRKKYPDADVNFSSVWAREYERYMQDPEEETQSEDPETDTEEEADDNADDQNSDS